MHRPPNLCNTKVGQKADNNPERDLLLSLDRMGIDYVDLCLIHDPNWIAPNSLVETWKIMESLKERGLCRSIGVSNLFAEALQALCDRSKTVPSINQIEFSPYASHGSRIGETIDICKSLNITVSPFSSLSSLRKEIGGPLDEPVERIAAARGATKEQVLLLWASQISGGPVVTATQNRMRMNEFTKIFEPKWRLLDDQELEDITKSGKEREYHEWIDEYRFEVENL
ncbi:MAG: hypothetical protein TREMPRED_000213, partial [Tremellales sp. Tagirdzhanova-0007]